MKQIYKIYLNDIVVVLTESKQVFNIPKNFDTVSIYDCKEDSDLSKIIDKIENNKITTNIILISKDLKWLKDTFFKQFKIIIAGGGYVLNKQKEILMMFRKGKWDIPKGKIEKGEGIKEGSIREVEEETGVGIKTVEKKLGKTYHTYKLKGKRVLKETHWYKMKAKKNQELTPQLDEGIEEVKWVTKKEAKKLLPLSYSSIQEVFDMV